MLNQIRLLYERYRIARKITHNTSSDDFHINMNIILIPIADFLDNVESVVQPPSRRSRRNLPKATILTVCATTPS